MKSLPTSVRFKKETEKRVVTLSAKTGLKPAEIIRAGVDIISRKSAEELFAAVMKYRTEAAK